MDQKQPTFMKLELRKFDVNDVQFGETTTIENGCMFIRKDELSQYLNRDGFFSSIEVNIARPGEKVRIIHVMDVVQPRIKLSGGATPFPGALGAVSLAGSGQTNVIEGVSVIQTGLRAGIQEGIVDMSGPVADYSIFSTTNNIVLEFVTRSEMTDFEFDRASRKALLEAAVYLAEPTRNLVPDSIETFQLDAPSTTTALPNIVYIYHLQSQGLLRDTFVYGENARTLLPTLMHPNEILDGAVVSSNYIIACQKNPTYFHLNNPVILDLTRRHQKDLMFLGVIIANEHSTLREKERSAKFAAKLAKQLGADGAIITQEGGGHADTDLMFNCRECDNLGIKTVIIANEIAGVAGNLPSLVDTIPDANAAVTSGNNDEQIVASPMEIVLGGDNIAGVNGLALQSFSTTLGRIYTATNQFGAYNLTIKSM